MPALDIGQIRGEAAELSRLFGEPNAFASATREFFQVHSVPTYKQSPVVSVHAPLKTFGAPAPAVWRSLRPVPGSSSPGGSSCLSASARSC